MKRLAIFILSVFLLVPTGALACWDDDWDDWDDSDSWYDDSWYDDDWSYDDDWYNDDSWLDDDDNYDGGWLDDVVITPDDNDNDIAWDEDLPELVVTPDDGDDDYDWGLDEDWWRTDDDNDDDYSSSDDDYQDSGDETDDGSNAGSKKDNSTTIGAIGKEFKDYKIQEGDKIIIKDHVDKTWRKQPGSKACVLTAMEYVSQILKDNNLNYITTYAEDYKHFINSDKENVLRDGIYGSELEALLNLEFNYEKITYFPEFSEALDVGCPILSIIDGNVIDFLEEPIEHMVVIIGEIESGGMYICIDPSDGGYKTISSFSLIGDSYKINYLKRY